MNKNIYSDIATRTNGNIYIGVVGPVRTGKSTFIKSFMEQMVIPKIEDIYIKERAIDELPQSGSGRTIMTAEPKFVPEEAVRINLDKNSSFFVRLIDSVGYMIPGAIGQFEDQNPRMIKTSWFDYEIPLSQAAEIGTKKVICDHSTIGIVITTDGSIGDLPREDYIVAEERIIEELIEIKKPFCILINSVNPQDVTTQNIKNELSTKYNVPCKCVNCMTISTKEIEQILTDVLYEFSVNEYCFTVPEWITILDDNDTTKNEVYQTIYYACNKINKMSETSLIDTCLNDCAFIDSISVKNMDLAKGCVSFEVQAIKTLFYEKLSDYCGINITDEGCLMDIMKDFSSIKSEYNRISTALEQVRQTGYGIIMPTPHELTLEKPEIIKQGGKSGVKLKASAPSIHLIRADIETEINPIVGSEKQSEDLVKYLLSEFEDAPDKIWETNIFGKSLSELVNEGLNNKLYKMPEDARAKLRHTLERVINEGNGGLICIIL